MGRDGIYVLENKIMKLFFLSSLIIFITSSMKALPIEKNIKNKFKNDKALVNDLNVLNLPSKKNNEKILKNL